MVLSEIPTPLPPGADVTGSNQSESMTNELFVVQLNTKMNVTSVRGPRTPNHLTNSA